MIYTHCSIGLFPKSGTNELNKEKKIPKIGQNDVGRNDQAETTEDRNDMDSGYRLKVLDFLMGKKQPIVHRQFPKTITNRFAGSSRRIIN